MPPKAEPELGVLHYLYEVLAVPGMEERVLIPMAKGPLQTWSAGPVKDHLKSKGLTMTANATAAVRNWYKKNVDQLAVKKEDGQNTEKGKAKATTNPTTTAPDASIKDEPQTPAVVADPKHSLKPNNSGVSDATAAPERVMTRSRKAGNETTTKRKAPPATPAGDKKPKVEGKAKPARNTRGSAGRARPSLTDRRAVEKKAPSVQGNGPTATAKADAGGKARPRGGRPSRGGVATADAPPIGALNNSRTNMCTINAVLTSLSNLDMFQLMLHRTRQTKLVQLLLKYCDRTEATAWTELKRELAMANIIKGGDKYHNSVQFFKNLVAHLDTLVDQPQASEGGTPSRGAYHKLFGLGTTGTLWCPGCEETLCEPITFRPALVLPLDTSLDGVLPTPRTSVQALYNKTLHPILGSICRLCSSYQTPVYRLSKVLSGPILVMNVLYDEKRKPMGINKVIPLSVNSVWKLDSIVLHHPRPVVGHYSNMVFGEGLSGKKKDPIWHVSDDTVEDVTNMTAWTDLVIKGIDVNPVLDMLFYRREDL